MVVSELIIYFRPQIVFMAKTKELTDIRDIIMKRMKDEGRNLTWLSQKTDISYNTIFSCLRKKLFSLSPENLSKINEALRTSFEQG